MTGSFCGQLRQNPLDLLLLLQLQFPQGIVGIDGGHGLDEVGAAGGGNVMDKARYIIAALRFDRHHIAALADCDNGLPEELGIGGRGNDLLKAVPDLARLNAHMAANVRQSGRGIVGDLFLG